MSAQYISKRVGEGLVRIERVSRGVVEECLWDRCTLRKPKRCAVSGRELVPGDLAYRPVGNVPYRYERIAAELIDDA